MMQMKLSTVWPVHNNQEASKQHLGRYEVVSPIGSGGMATIYLARIAGPAGFEKPVAVKVIHTHLSEDQQFVQMFFDEARLAAQLQHPNIVQIFELGEAEGVYFIAMEYLRGETLGSVIQRAFKGQNRSMDPRFACHIIQQSCEGLHYAHELRNIEDEPLHLVHRDISPQNLFVTYSGSVKLMDFGIARATGHAHSTRPGSLKGKFSYMSPETVGGDDVDRRSDIFALGVVFWELLTGRRLFKGRNDMDSLRLVEECKIPPTSQFRSGIPPSLDKVLARSLARDPKDRYQTALDLHNDIGLVMDQLGSPVNTHELSQKMRAWFTKEEEKQRKLLSRTLTDQPRLPAGDASEAPTVVEGTPSVSEPSGIRLKDVDILQIDGKQTTPSHSGTWDVGSGSVNVSGATQNGELTVQEGAGALGGASDHEPAEEAGRNVWTLVLLTCAGILAIVLVVMAALLLPYLDLFEMPGQGRDRSDLPAIDPRLISSDPLAEDPSLPPLVTPSEEPPEVVPQGGDDQVEATGPVPEPVTPTPGEGRFVTFSLDVRPPRATVSVDGEVQEDPRNIRVPQSSESVQIVVDAPRYQRVSFRMTPDMDRARSVSLRRRPRQPPGAKQPERPAEDLVSNPYSPR